MLHSICQKSTSNFNYYNQVTNNQSEQFRNWNFLNLFTAFSIVYFYLSVTHVAAPDHVVEVGATHEVIAALEVGVAAVPEVKAKTRSQRADLPVLIVRNQNLHQSRVLAPAQGQDLVRTTKIMVIVKTVMTEIMMISVLLRLFFFLNRHFVCIARIFRLFHIVGVFFCRLSSKLS